jgi:hypothetical protein
MKETSAPRGAPQGMVTVLAALATMGTTLWLLCHGSLPDARIGAPVGWARLGGQGEIGAGAIKVSDDKWSLRGGDDDDEGVDGEGVNGEGVNGEGDEAGNMEEAAAGAGLESDEASQDPVSNNVSAAPATSSPPSTWRLGTRLADKVALALALGPALEPELGIAPDVDLAVGGKACLSRNRYQMLQGEFAEWGLRPELLPTMSGREYAQLNCSVMQLAPFLLNFEVPEGVLLSSLGIGSCASGGKASQTQCRRKTAKDAGCSFEAFDVQPRTYNLFNPAECRAFLEASGNGPTETQTPKQAQKHSAKQWWLIKPSKVDLSHGRGQRLLATREAAEWVARRSESCSRKEYHIVQAYQMRPALLAGHKFDVRTYALVARAKPFLLFYASGFIRVADHVFSLDNTDVQAHITNSVLQSRAEHFLTFARAGELAAAQGTLEPGFFEHRFRARAELITRYVFLALRSSREFKQAHKARRYNVYGLDWILDEHGNAQLLEGNAKCDQSNSIMGESFYSEALRLAITAHVAPRTLVQSSWAELAPGYTYGPWKMLYSSFTSPPDNACGLLADINATWLHAEITSDSR